MKKIFNTFLCILVIGTASYGQNLLVANNNPGAASGVNVFTGSTALQDAITASANGDIIYVVPSIINYGNIAIDKGITVFGIGIRADKNLGAKSIVTRIDIMPLM